MKELHDATKHLVERYRRLARLLEMDEVERALVAVNEAVVAVDKAETSPSDVNMDRARSALDEAELALRALAAAAGRRLN